MHRIDIDEMIALFKEGEYCRSNSTSFRHESYKHVLIKPGVSALGNEFYIEDVKIDTSSCVGWPWNMHNGDPGYSHMTSRLSAGLKRNICVWFDKVSSTEYTTFILMLFFLHEHKG